MIEPPEPGRPMSMIASERLPRTSQRPVSALGWGLVLAGGAAIWGLVLALVF